MNHKYIVSLTEQETKEIIQIFEHCKCTARKLIRAMVLLLANKQASIEEIADFTDSSTSTVKRVTKRFVLYGVEYALNEKSRHFKSRKLDEKQQAKLIALACTDPPEGRNKWTLRLLADKYVEIDENLPIISRETVRRTLKKSNFKPWQKKMWCIPKVTSDFIAKMEHILDLYNGNYNDEYPLICLDETPVQLIGETRNPIPAKPGQPRKYDYEYRRNGVVNLFVAFDPQKGWRHIEVTDRRTKQDFAKFIKKIVDEFYPNAKRIKIVLDNLNTHKMGSLYATFPPAEAARIMKKLEFHYPPPHASWLNMVEIEISRLSKQCLQRRIPTKESLKRQISKWEQQENDSKSTIVWSFNQQEARRKLKRHYTQIQEFKVSK